MEVQNVKRNCKAGRAACALGIAAAALAIGLAGCARTYKIDLGKVSRPLDTATIPYTDIFAEWDGLTTESLVRRTAQQIGASYGQAGEVWPGVDYSGFQVLFFQDGKEDAWLVKPDGSAVALPLAALPASIAKLPFYSSALDNRLNGESTSISRIDADYLTNPENRRWEYAALPQDSFLYTVVSHEEFHAYQRRWGVVYRQEKLFELKNEPQARVLRLHLLESLRQAILQPDRGGEYLGAAKFWLERYNAEFPAEARLVKGADILEGSARYFHVAMLVRSTFGPGASAATVTKAYRDLVAKDYLPARRYDSFPDSESYELGGAAGILLELEGSPGWQKRVEKGESPVDILLERVAATPQAENPDLVRIVAEYRPAKR